MYTKLATIAVLATAAITLTGVASAEHVASTQRVAIQNTPGDRSFVLTPLSAGTIKPDSGTATACCWTSRFIMRNGQKLEINDPRMTLTGTQGTLVIRKRIEWADLPGGYAISTGTWKIISGTGAYATLSGGGRHAGVQLPNGDFRWRDEGFVAPK
jgi:hypothetical protein